MERKYAEYLLEKTIKNYNLIAENFSKYRERPWPEANFLINDYIISGEKILDLGCGAGQWFKFFKEKEVDYIGIDNSERLIEIAKKRYPEAKFQVGDALNLPFPNNYFDKVYSIAVFHHIPSLEFRLQFLKEARRVLKPERILILTVWNLWRKRKIRKLIYKFAFLKIFGKSKLDFKDILMDWQGMSDCYFHCFTKNELKKLVKKVGFNIIKEGEILVGLGRKKRAKLLNSNFYIVAKKL